MIQIQTAEQPNNNIAFLSLMQPPHGPGPIDDVDTLIAATAQVHHLIVVTADDAHNRVPQLQVQLIERTWLNS